MVVGEEPDVFTLSSSTWSSKRATSKSWTKATLFLRTLRGVLSDSRKGDASPTSPASPEPRRPRFEDVFDLGVAAGTSSQPGTQVRSATRRRDGRTFVVKIKNRFGHGESAFCSAQAETAWLLNSEHQLKLPECKHIARIVQIFKEQKIYYVVMEEAQGSLLFDVARKGQLQQKEMQEIISQLLTALAVIHEAGLIHRDVKLDNAMVSKGPFLRLFDFDDVQPWPKDPLRSHVWVAGTDQFIAPEAYAGDCCPASDIFAAGTMLFCLLFGRFPFDELIFDDDNGENWIGSPKMDSIRLRLLRSSIDWTSNRRIDTQALDLCRSMLDMNSSRRPTAIAALEHPWLRPPAPAPAPKLSWGTRMAPAWGTRLRAAASSDAVVEICLPPAARAEPDRKATAAEMLVPVPPGWVP